MNSRKKMRSRRQEAGATTSKRNTRSNSSVGTDVNLGSSDADGSSTDLHSRFLQLPEMIMLHIFVFLSAKDKCRSSRVCKTFRRLLKDPHLWKYVDLTPYTIRLTDLTKFTRRYLSKSLEHLEVRGFLQSNTVKTNLLSEAYFEELKSHCPNITVLAIDNAELRHLSSTSLPHSLEHLHFTACQLRESWLTPAMEAGTLCNIVCLYLPGCGRVTNRDVAAMSNLKNLRKLSLLGCYRLTDQALETISTDHIHLTTLLIGHADFSDVGIQGIALNLKNLDSFSIQNCEFLSDRSLKYIESMKTIKELDISYNQQFCVAAIYSLVKNLPNLQRITVQDVGSVKDEIMLINPSVEVL